MVACKACGTEIAITLNKRAKTRNKIFCNMTCQTWWKRERPSRMTEADLAKARYMHDEMGLTIEGIAWSLGISAKRLSECLAPSIVLVSSNESPAPSSPAGAGSAPAVEPI